MLKFDVITVTADVSIGNYGIFLHEHKNKVFICKLCQLADMNMYTCLVEVSVDGVTEWKTVGYTLYGADKSIKIDAQVNSSMKSAVDELLDAFPEYMPTYKGEEGMRPFKDIAELYSVYAKEKQWTLQTDLHGDVIRLDTIAALPVFYKHRDEDCVRMVARWGHNGVDGITWQDFFDSYELVTWYDFRTHDYESIPCGILHRN